MTALTLAAEVVFLDVVKNMTEAAGKYLAGKGIILPPVHYSVTGERDTQDAMAVTNYGQDRDGRYYARIDYHLDEAVGHDPVEWLFARKNRTRAIANLARDEGEVYWFTADPIIGLPRLSPNIQFLRQFVLHEMAHVARAFCLGPTRPTWPEVEHDEHWTVLFSALCLNFRLTRDQIEADMSCPTGRPLPTPKAGALHA